jgi:RNA polymerase sigma-70 factor (ECF subfamily)
VLQAAGLQPAPRVSSVTTTSKKLYYLHGGEDSISSSPRWFFARRNQKGTNQKIFMEKSTATAFTPRLPRTEPVEMTEREAIQRAQNGDAAAFEFLYQRCSKRVFAVCVRMVKDRSVAEDLTQEVFMQMFRKISAFRGDSSIATWLYRIAVNTALLYLRSRRAKPESELNADASSTEDDNGNAEIPCIDRALTGTVDRLNLERAIDLMPAGYRQIFLLHDVMGFQHHEIASYLDCTIGNTKSQLHKARLRLRCLLQGEIAKKSRERVLATAVSAQHE